MYKTSKFNPVLNNCIVSLLVLDVVTLSMFSRLNFFYSFSLQLQHKKLAYIIYIYTARGKLYFCILFFFLLHPFLGEIIFDNARAKTLINLEHPEGEEFLEYTPFIKMPREVFLETSKFLRFYDTNKMSQRD